MGICVELDKSIQTGCVKLITAVKGAAEFLKHLGMLYKAFSVHQKHQVVQKLPLDEAIELLKVVDAYLKRSTDEVMSLFDKPSKPMGAKGTISSQTQSSSRSSRAEHELPSRSSQLPHCPSEKPTCDGSF